MNAECGFFELDQSFGAKNDVGLRKIFKRHFEYGKICIHVQNHLSTGPLNR